MAIMTSLLAAYINKEKFVDRIKEIDRYIQKVGKINRELYYIINSKVWNRISYESFIDKYKSDILILFSYPPPLSPNDFKNTVFLLTVYYPELISNTYPWYVVEKIGNIEYYKMTSWGSEIIDSYSNYKLCFCKNFKNNIFKNHETYNRHIIHMKELENMKKNNDFKEDINIDINFNNDIKEKVIIKKDIKENIKEDIKKDIHIDIKKDDEK